MSDDFWQIWIDTGGTFTDCLAVNPEGALLRAKVLSSSALRGKIKKVLSQHRIVVEQNWNAPDHFIDGFYFHVLEEDSDLVCPVKTFWADKSIIEFSGDETKALRPGQPFEVKSPDEAPILAARLVTRTPAGIPLPPIQMRLATTRGTNALLERKGAPIALFITKGFRDLLQIGTQQRSDLFALNIQKPEPLYVRVVEVDERLAANGEVLKPIDCDQLSELVSDLLSAGIRHAAIAFLHSYLNPQNEQLLAAFLQEKGFHSVSLSSELAPFIKLLSRAETAVVNAYLEPVLRAYLGNVKGSISTGRLHVMTSAGGLVQADAFQPKDSLLSGPAGGVVGAAHVGKTAGFKKVIAFDMGGTSTDVSRYTSDFEYLFEHKVGDAHLVAPALAIESVAAGGGSICWFDGQQLRVGPHSAGADPGPACYGAGGPLTLTDVNLLLGRLDPSRFEIPIVPERAEKRLQTILTDIHQKTGTEVGREEVLEGFLLIANERMADAIRRISLRKGYDPAEYALVAFGGAGPQHACAVAEQLNIRTILVPRDAGLLSALGIGHAMLERFAEKQLLKPLSEVESRLPEIMNDLTNAACSAVESEGIPRDNIIVRRKIVNLRFTGQDSSLSIEFTTLQQLRNDFEQQYRTIFGHWPSSREIEVETVRVVASTPPVEARFQEEVFEETYNPQPMGEQKTWFKGQWQRVPTFDFTSLKPGAKIAGPALIFEAHSATVLEPDWTAILDNHGTLVCSFYKTISTSEEQESEVIRLELFTSRFQTIANEMGEMLRRTALSTNIKERLDFSCAIMDAHGDLVVNAAHIPVHLGAMSLCVKRLTRHISWNAGDVVVTNHPRYGGSHLPDVTVVSPVFTPEGNLIGFVANRAHHAELGGIRPGSMPPDASCLAEEGVVIPPTYLVKAGEPDWHTITRLLTTSDYPSRTPEENLADLNAAVAANRKGVHGLLNLVEKYGEETVIHFMDALKQKAEQKVRDAFAALPEGIFEAEERLDDGSPIRVTISIHGNEAVFDFTGTHPVHSGNMNATEAIVRSAVIYVLRLLVNEPLPLNEGFMSPVRLKLPTCMLNPDFPEDPRRAPSIVGGNVETSQRLVDTLLKAFGLVACSQGTMNNVLFGNDEFSYYETICGGCGAGPTFHGASAVHSHMTNTRITDPEIVEHRYPVRIEQFYIRANSGGKGRYCGGNGVIRAIRFLKPLSLSILSQHRIERPYGLKGGEAGAVGQQWIETSSGCKRSLGPIDGYEVSAGDLLVICTPGGGGYGKPNEQNRK